MIFPYLSRWEGLMGQDLEKWILEQNIERFEFQLRREEDPVQRKLLQKLIARERDKLQARRAD